MAYWVEQRTIFQGSLGPGTDPDNSEGGNSYPSGLDLSKNWS